MDEMFGGAENSKAASCYNIIFVEIVVHLFKPRSDYILMN